jgi:hypothetical protein
MRIPLLLAAWLMLWLAGCGGSDGTPPAPGDQGLAPIEAFLGNPKEATGHKLSPEQTQVAFLQSSQGLHGKVMNLFEPVEYLPFPEEGHSDWCEKNYLELFRAVERFLGRHLGSRVAP